MTCIAGPDMITPQRIQDLLSGRAVITSNVMNGQIRQASEELRVPVQEIATCEHQNSFEQHMIVTSRPLSKLRRTFDAPKLSYIIPSGCECDPYGTQVGLGFNN